MEMTMIFPKKRKAKRDRTMTVLTLFTFLIMVLMMAGDSAGLTCFNCPEGCHIDNKTEILECPENASLGFPVCVRTIISTIHGAPRGLACSFANFTPLGVRIEHKYICNEDLCNGSERLAPSSALSIGLVIMTFSVALQ